ALETGPHGACPFRRWPGRPLARRAAFLLGGLALRRDLHAGAPRLRQTDGDRLLCRARAVLPLAHVMDFLAHELAGLGRRRLSLGRVASGPLDRFLLGHAAPPIEFACGQLHLLCHTRRELSKRRSIVSAANDLAESGWIS